MGKSKSDWKLAFVVATKDRPLKLKNLLISLNAQTHKPYQIIIIDSSEKPLNPVIKGFSELNICYRHFTPPSATKQRNAGIMELNRDIELVGFLDDDIELEKDALKNVLEFWNEAANDVGGVALNLVNHPSLELSRLKTSSLSHRFGLYSDIKGRVSLSGFHSLIGYIEKDIDAQWLPSTAVMWRKTILEKYRFDEWYEGYSYLEDLDFSYDIGKEYKLMVCASARYYHYPAETGRGTPFAFGKKEVINRIYFVKKHKELSLLKCYTAIFVRILLSLSFAITKRDFRFVERALGSFVGLFISIFLWSSG